MFYNEVMLSLYQDPYFLFRFVETRLIPRFHLEGIGKGQQIEVYRIDPESGVRLARLARATVGEAGWVDLLEPILIHAGEAFIAVSA